MSVVGASSKLAAWHPFKDSLPFEAIHVYAVNNTRLVGASTKLAAWHPFKELAATPMGKPTHVVVGWRVAH